MWLLIFSQINLKVRHLNPSSDLVESKKQFTFYIYQTLLSKATYSAFWLCICLSVCVFPGNWTHNLCTANALLYHWATGTQWTYCHDDIGSMQFGVHFRHCQHNFLVIITILCFVNLVANSYNLLTSLTSLMVRFTGGPSCLLFLKMLHFHMNHIMKIIGPLVKH